MTRGKGMRRRNIKGTRRLRKSVSVKNKRRQIS